MATAGRPVISRKTVQRLSRYRRLLSDLQETGTTSIYSHQLAHLAGVSAAQVRRDFMVIGYSGSPNRGYQLDTCLASIEHLLDGTTRQDVALVGLGRLGHSVLTHFAGRRPLLRIAAGLRHQSDPDRDLGGGLPGTRDGRPRAGGQAEGHPRGHHRGAAGDRPGGRGFAGPGRACAASWTSPPSLCACRANVFVRHMDITSALETAAFFARQDGDAGAGHRCRKRRRDQRRGRDGAHHPTIDSLLAGADMKLDELARRIGAKRA